MTFVLARALGVGNKFLHPFVTKDKRVLTIENIEHLKNEDFQQIEAYWYSPTGRKFQYYFALPSTYRIDRVDLPKVQPGESHAVQEYYRGYSDGVKASEQYKSEKDKTFFDELKEQAKKEYWRGVEAGKAVDKEGKADAYERGYKAGIKEGKAVDKEEREADAYERGYNVGKVAARQEKDEAYERGYKEGKGDSEKAYKHGYNSALRDVKGWVDDELPDD